MGINREVGEVMVGDIGTDVYREGVVTLCFSPLAVENINT